MPKKKESQIKKYFPIIAGFLFSLFFGGLSIVLFLLLSNNSQAQPIATEEDFDPKILYSHWNDKEPWMPCSEWVDVRSFSDTAKAEAVKCVEERDKALKERRDYYLDPNMGRHKARACNRACVEACEAAEASSFMSADCENGYISRPNEIEKVMLDCKNKCYDTSRAEENALRSPTQVIRQCCEGIEISEVVEDGPNCFDGVQNGNEEGVDCGGACEIECETDVLVSVSPKEVEMVADGKTSMDFVVTIIQDGEPLAGQEVSFRLNDERNQVDDDKEGEVVAKAGATDVKGQVIFTYTTAEQPRDFTTSTLVFQAVNQYGNPRARITLTPGFSIWCGNWQCQTGETHANCPEDCAKDLSRDEAYDYLVKKYNEIPLNPYARQGVWCASCPTNNRVLKAMAIETISSDQAKLDYAKRLKEKYEPWVCGSQQTRVINMLDGLRLSKDATERSIIEKYFDYGPVEVVAPYVLNTLAGHLAVAIYPKNTFWRDTAEIFDIWMKNNHGIYGIEDWEFMTDGRAGGFQCDPPFYPLCGGSYQRVKHPEFKLTPEEEAYKAALPQEVKNRLKASLNERAYSDVRDAQEKYMIERMMAFDARDKVRVVVECPFNVMIVNKETGERVGYDTEGNFVAEDTDVYPEIRAYKDSEVISYFMMPKDGDYEVKAAGIDSGKATVMTSYPTDDGEFEIYEYNNIDVKADSVLVLNLDSDKAKATLTIDEKQINSKLREKGVADDSVDYLVAVAEGLYPEENQPGLGGEIFPEEFTPLMFEPLFDGWSVLMLILALALFALGIVYFVKLRKKGKKTLGIVILALTWLAGILFLLIVAGRYVGEQEEVGSDYRGVNNNEQIINKKQSDNESLTKNEEIVEEVRSDVAEDVEDSSLSYTNDEYGYQLKMTPGWKGYMAETLPIDNERAVAVTQFYLPTEEDSEYSDKSGWFKMMIVTVYPLEAWKEERAECEELDLCWEEEIGRDANFVYAWSFFNGIQPDDIAEEAIMDMEQIVDSFVPATIAPVVVWDENTIMQIYQNCTYGYKIIYPKHWMDVTRDTYVQNASFKGDGITISIFAFDDGLTLDEFAANRTAAWSSAPASSRDQERNGKRLIAYEFTDPEAVYVFWEEGEYNLEMAVTGKDITEFIIGTGFFADFNNNIDRKGNCE